MHGPIARVHTAVLTKKHGLFTMGKHARMCRPCEISPTSSVAPRAAVDLQGRKRHMSYRGRAFWGGVRTHNDDGQWDAVHIRPCMQGTMGWQPVLNLNFRQSDEGHELAMRCDIW